jgi:hypothetical protein
MVIKKLIYQVNQNGFFHNFHVGQKIIWNILKIFFSCLLLKFNFFLNNNHIFLFKFQNIYPKHLTAKQIFLERLMKLASEKVKELLKNDKFIQDRRHLSNLIDECVLFEREMQESFGYLEESKIHVISIICNFEQVLESWIRLERDTLSAGVDSILADENAYEPRYKEAADVDPV